MMTPEAWHHIRGTDDGRNVAVYMSGTAVAGWTKKQHNVWCLIIAQPRDANATIDL